MLSKIWSSIQSLATGGGPPQDEVVPRVAGRKWARTGEESPDVADDGENPVWSPDPHQGQSGSVLIVSSPSTKGPKEAPPTKRLTFAEDPTMLPVTTSTRYGANNNISKTKKGSIQFISNNTDEPPINVNLVAHEVPTQVVYTLPKKGIPFSDVRHLATVTAPTSSAEDLDAMSVPRRVLSSAPQRRFHGQLCSNADEFVSKYRQQDRMRWKNALSGKGVSANMRLPTLALQLSGSASQKSSGGSLKGASTETLLRMLSCGSGLRSPIAAHNPPTFLPPSGADDETAQIKRALAADSSNFNDDDDDDIIGYEAHLDHLVAASNAVLERAENVGRGADSCALQGGGGCGGSDAYDPQPLIDAIHHLRAARADHEGNMLPQRGGRPTQPLLGLSAGHSPAPSSQQTSQHYSRFCTYPGLHSKHIEEALAHEASTGEHFSTTYGPRSFYTLLKTQLLAHRGDEGTSSNDVMTRDAQLLDAVASATRELVHSEVHKSSSTVLNTTWQTVYEMVRKMVVSAAIPQCPEPEGVIRHITSKTPAAVPVKFTDEDETRVASLRSYPQRGKYVIVDKEHGYEIERYQLESCFGAEKLNDQVMNYYCTLVKQQGDGVTVLLSSFYTKLTSEINSGATEFPNAFRWVRTKNIFESRVVLVVINQNDHWTLCVVHNENKTVTYYDSCGGAGTTVLSNVANFFNYAFAKQQLQKGVVSIDTVMNNAVNSSSSSSSGPSFMDSYSYHSPCTVGVPQQRNLVDCGVFALQFCLYAALERPFNFRQNDIPYLRRLIPLELLSGRLMARL